MNTGAMLRGLLAAGLLAAGCARSPEQTAARAVADLLHSDQAAAAAEAVEICLRENPQSVRLRELRALILLQLERIDEAATALAALPDPSAVLAEGLRSPDTSLRAHTARLLAERDFAIGCRPLIAGTDDAHPEVRQWSALALGRRPHCRANRALYRLLQDDNFTVRNAAARALGERGDPRAVGWLIAALLNYNVAPTAIPALTRLAGPANQAVLQRAFATGAVGQRIGVAPALLKLGDSRGLTLLRETAKDPTPASRTLTAYALATTGDNATARELLGELAEDQDFSVRETARQLLKPVVPALPRP